MHLQHMPDAMAGAMRVIQTHCPHGRTRQRINLLAGCASWEPRQRNGNMCAQHSGKGIAHAGIRRAYGNSAGDIGRAVIVMRPGINQQQAVLQQFPVLPSNRTVMDNGPVRPAAADGVET